MDDSDNSDSELANRTRTSLQTALKAGIATIPVVGGALDHLIFDRAAELRIQNIENSIKYIADKIASMQESNIDKEWFGSIDALDIFKSLGLHIETEPDEEKIKILSETYAKFGMLKNSSNVYKKVVLDKIGQMSSLQRIVFMEICKFKNTPQSSPSISSAISKIYKNPNQSRLTSSNPAPMNIRFEGVPIAQFCEIFKQKQQTDPLISKINCNVECELQILNNYSLLQQPSGTIDSHKFYQITEIGNLVYEVLS